MTWKKFAEIKRASIVGIRYGQFLHRRRSHRQYWLQLRSTAADQLDCIIPVGCAPVNHPCSFGSYFYQFLIITEAKTPQNLDVQDFVETAVLFPLAFREYISAGFSMSLVFLLFVFLYFCQQFFTFAFRLETKVQPQTCFATTHV